MEIYLSVKQVGEIKALQRRFCICGREINLSVVSGDGINNLVYRSNAIYV